MHILHAVFAFTVALTAIAYSRSAASLAAAGACFDLFSFLVYGQPSPKFKAWKEYRVVETVAEKIGAMAEKLEIARKVGVAVVDFCRDSRMMCKTSRREIGHY